MEKPIVRAVITEKEAAQYIGMSVPYLRASRCNGTRDGHTTAPPYVKIGGGRSIRYMIGDLDNWLHENRVDVKQCCR